MLYVKHFAGYLCIHAVGMNQHLTKKGETVGQIITVVLQRVFFNLFWSEHNGKKKFID